MNIYLITEDGVSFCIRAKKMHEALLVCERSYIDERVEQAPHCSIEHEKEYYHENILESCQLVGELKN